MSAGHGHEFVFAQACLLRASTHTHMLLNLSQDHHRQAVCSKVAHGSWATQRAGAWSSPSANATWRRQPDVGGSADSEGAGLGNFRHISRQVKRGAPQRLDAGENHQSSGSRFCYGLQRFSFVGQGQQRSVDNEMSILSVLLGRGDQSQSSSSVMEQRRVRC